MLRSGATRTLWLNPSKAGCVSPPLPENINLSTNVKEFNQDQAVEIRKKCPLSLTLGCTEFFFLKIDNAIIINFNFKLIFEVFHFYLAPVIITWFSGQVNFLKLLVVTPVIDQNRAILSGINPECVLAHWR